ncbi:uncharacterized protein BYT42DRAFT_612718 [Radiomyces spectabilis]|uniref:uncharacterized protein n=1 Tax=Radiomyces spectabilis TaxID=64574 RepID=UPI002220F331|nr:uncharacterized protein BYT42DRAFT_612718 [Radiomyces spectabilis]KAI8380884.1 hypothetical protein BYT42DRAFT_612718 [Radiomyces spectabilis]
MTIVYITNIVISACVIIIGVGLLLHRRIVQGHRMFEAHSPREYLRPKPIDGMLFLIMIFNLLRLINSVILITNVADNPISRSFMYEFPWQFGYGSFVLYVVGIARTLANSHKSVSSGWLPSTQTVDIVGVILFFAPFIINNTCSLAAGILDFSHYEIAVIFTRLLYIFWFIHCTGLAITVMWAGIRLINVLNQHLRKAGTSTSRYATLKTGIFKIRTVMSIIVVCLMLFAALLLAFGLLRTHILKSVAGSIFVGAVWNFLGPAATILVEIAIIFNPKIDDPNLGLKSSSGGKTSQTNDSQLSTVGNSQTFAFSESKELPTFSFMSPNDDLKEQQLRYEEVFHRYNLYANMKNSQTDHKMPQRKESALPLNPMHQESSESTDTSSANTDFVAPDAFASRAGLTLHPA